MSKEDVLEFNFQGERVRVAIRYDQIMLFIEDVIEILNLVNKLSKVYRLLELNDIKFQNRRQFLVKYEKGFHTAITIEGVYILTYNSYASNARDFEKWIYKEVVPYVRDFLEQIDSNLEPEPEPEPEPDSIDDLETEYDVSNMSDELLLEYIKNIEYLSSDYLNRNPDLAEKLRDMLIERLFRKK